MQTGLCRGYRPGITLKDLGRLDEAEAACRKALAIKPAYADAHSNLGVVLHDLGRWGEAADSYRRALEIRPNSAETLQNLGATLQNLDLLDERRPTTGWPCKSSQAWLTPITTSRPQAI